MAWLIQGILRFVRSFRTRTNLPPEPDLDDYEDTGPTLVDFEFQEVEVSRPVLSRGSGDYVSVIELQKALIASGEVLAADGQFGPGTESAVRAVQISYGLSTSGKADAPTWEVLDRRFGSDVAYQNVPLPAPLPVTSTSGVALAWNNYGGLLTTLGGVLGLPPSVACAVLAAESAGAGFWDGRLVIRFENHVFRSRWGKANPAVFDAHFKVDSRESWKGHAWRPGTGAWRTLHTEGAGQDEEWAVTTYARTLDEEAALQSISMGAPQIMGFNHTKIGFLTARAMFDAFSVDERVHVLGLFDFIRADHRLVRALRASDWTGFARIYNGTGQATDYGKRIGGYVADVRKLGVK
jgi:hypothetical protein